MCGSDGVTYTNECLLNRAKCVKRLFIMKVKEGPCEEVTDVAEQVDLDTEIVGDTTMIPDIIDDEKVEKDLEEELFVTTDIPMLTIPDDEKELSTLVPEEILDDEAIDTTMKPIIKFEDEDEIETTMMSIIDDVMVSTYTVDNF